MNRITVLHAFRPDIKPQRLTGRKTSSYLLTYSARFFLRRGTKVFIIPRKNKQTNKDSCSAERVYVNFTGTFFDRSCLCAQ